MPAPHGPNIVIDKHHFQAPQPDMTGAALKALGGVPADFRLFKINPGPNPDEPIGDAEVVHLHDGEHFYSLPPGRVGDLLPSVQAEIDELLAAIPDAIVQVGDAARFFIEIPVVYLPKDKGWDQAATRILLPVPSAYPTSRPPNFYVGPELTRNGAAPGGKGGPEPIAGGQWAAMCWAPAHSEEARRSLLACIRFALARFWEAQ